MANVKSGIKCYLSFAEIVLKKGPGKKLPPVVNDLLAWSALFRSHRTLANYMGCLRVGCLLEDVSMEAFAVRSSGGAQGQRSMSEKGVLCAQGPKMF